MFCRKCFIVWKPSVTSGRCLRTGHTIWFCTASAECLGHYKYFEKKKNISFKVDHQFNFKLQIFIVFPVYLCRLLFRVWFVIWCIIQSEKPAWRRWLCKSRLNEIDIFELLITLIKLFSSILFINIKYQKYEIDH